MTDTEKKCEFGLVQLRHELDAIVMTLDSERNKVSYKHCIDASVNLYQAIVELENNDKLER